MVRIPASSTTRPDPQLPPYPISPTSPSRDSARNHASDTPQDASWKPRPGFGNTPDMSDTERSGQVISHNGQDGLPPALRIGQETSTDHPEEQSDALRIVQSDLTPRSSFDSQRPGTPPQSAIASVDSTQPHPTNPFRRNPSPAPANPTSSPPSEDNTTAAWADPAFGANGRSPLQQSVGTHEAPTLPHAVPLENNPTAVWKEQQGNELNASRPSLPKQEGSYLHDLHELDTQSSLPTNEQIPNPELTQKPLPPAPSGQYPSQIIDQAPELPPWDAVAGQAPPPSQHALPQTQKPAVPDQTPQIAAVAGDQEARAKQQRNQIYQVRLVNWYDATAAVNPRTSPIMVQNANGPCPLLALVNALVLSTPINLETALVETLRVRETVSLGLLLDAVIDELMSGRRGNAAQALPDVSDLYAFLINLHTGMNVNPRFVEPTSAPNHLMDEPIGQSPDGPQEPRKVGGFEDTPHMRLYSTFAVSLIHGWLPRKNHPVCAVLDRTAKTYEDAQSLLFAEEELESKLQNQGLTEDEQKLLEDIGSVKYFLTSSPTQLTDYGLDTIIETLESGTMSILFRNDHFSTLYKEPRSRRIFTLVTDLGYAGHDEVVWESLVDINGEGSEFFSGDFRPVGNNVKSSGRRSTGAGATGDNAGWTTVSRSGGHGRSRNSLPAGTQNDGAAVSTAFSTAFSNLSVEEPHNMGTSEQQDHDLALAMMLQEEEEDRERQESAARRRQEDDLTSKYLDSYSHSGGPRNPRPQVPARRGGGARRAPPVRRTSDSNGEAPPPTYEQAAKGPAYHPPISTPQHTSATSRTNVNRGGMQGMRPQQRQSSAYSQTNAAFEGRGRPEPVGKGKQGKEDKECIVM